MYYPSEKNTSPTGWICPSEHPPEPQARFAEFLANPMSQVEGKGIYQKGETGSCAKLGAPNPDCSAGPRQSEPLERDLESTDFGILTTRLMHSQVWAQETPPR